MPAPRPTPTGAPPPIVIIPQIPGGEVRLPGRLPPTRPPAPRNDPSSIPARSSAAIQGSNTGILREHRGKQITIETDDHRVIWYRLADNLAGEGAFDFDLGDRLQVDHAEDDLGRYTAVTVQRVASATEESRKRAEQQWDLPSGNVEVEEKIERPRLTRGPRAKPTEPEPAPRREPAPRPSEPAPASALDPVIEMARAAAEEFAGTLPSFSVRQLTTRYLKEFARNDWVALDMVTANLRYRDGSESYSDITVGGKPTKLPMEDIQGARSTGEFYTLLQEVLDPASAAVYTRAGQEAIAGKRAWKYRYEIARERSRFRLETPSQLYYAAYRGSLWIDVDTHRVLRLEQEAVNLPERFPFDTAEVTVDYDMVRLERQFLLPVATEMLYCVRSTTACFRNHTDFRNYVKFEAESGIVFPDVGKP